MVIVEIGWQKFIMPREKALLMAELLECTELYEEKYWNTEKKKEKGITEDYTYHVYPNDKSYTMRIIPDSTYQMAKLAGKPEKD